MVFSLSSRHCNASRSQSLPFLKRPSPVVQLSQSQSPTFPVWWSWSATIFAVMPTMDRFWQTGRRRGLPVVGNEVGIPEPLAFHARHDAACLVDRVAVPRVVPARELADISVQMLRRHLVIDAMASPA